MTLRSAAQRIADTKQRLATDDDVWVATGSLDGTPHLVPLSMSWIKARIMCVTYTNSPTTRNVAATSQARCSLDSTGDVVILKTAAQIMAFEDCSDDAIQEMVDQFGWDPRHDPEIAWSVLVMTPLMIHAWNCEPEIANRTIMRDGAWVE